MALTLAAARKAQMLEQQQMEVAFLQELFPPTFFENQALYTHLRCFLILESSRLYYPLDKARYDQGV